MSVPAFVSLLGIVIVVGISMYNEDLNVGIVAIAFAILIGAVFADIPAAKVMQSWPVDLFMILAGVTFLFGIATTNGTMDKVTANAIRLAGGNTAMIPLIVFALIALITTIGPGNIATVTLMAPVAMAIAGRIGLSAFLMTLLVVGAANGAAFSPIAPTGIISQFFMTRMAPELAALGKPLGDIDLMAWRVYLDCELAQMIGNMGGFFVLGGLAWMLEQKHSMLSIDEVAPKPEPFTTHQWMTLAAVGTLVLLVILPGLSVTRPIFTPTVMNVLGNGKAPNVGALAFMLATVLLILNAGDSKEVVRSMPWSVIIMVGGMGILIEVMDKAGGLGALVDLIATVSGPVTVTGVLGLVTGVLSAYSSSSGVVMPMFLPLVPGLVKTVGGDPVSMIASINVGSHMVDTSPLSLFGAVCLACAAAHEDKGRLFRHLILWGFSMSVVGALLCYVFFGLLGL
ncbi:SLC13 family permease [Rhodoplanes sp. TEM]|uniref:SLC13 family permease n=1 Tax=Rhodoplanes tepidamans TaxID=200616 RepID=A0ABT5JC98_RHOTP|nr:MULTISPECIES: SLC13 family permease [Rhodoplanes]MDC7787241.1 SLC13 family permease [Rhodoplanes tepidamans]MDC7986586.1 SLC13 family permease [Rhodoplanes sp. TEM]MDQ0357776.1 di/tricarboxylate transporter [Rhodoplanes tepidamans]